MSVGQRIKLRRKELDLTVEEVAAKLGKNKATVYRYESDEIENLPITVIEPLAEILNVSPSYLMGWDEYSLNDIPLELLHHYQELGYSEEEMIEAYKDYEDAMRNDTQIEKEIAIDMSEDEIITLAAHKVGHEEGLTKEEIEKVKLAIKIALMKNGGKLNID